MDTALIDNLNVLANIQPYGDICIVRIDDVPWPPDPDTLPENMNLKTHALQPDCRWSWWRPFLRLISGDTDYAVVIYLMLLTRALELYNGQPHVSKHVHAAIGGLVRLQDTTYKNNQYVKLALITCRCAWRQYSLE